MNVSSVLFFVVGVCMFFVLVKIIDFWGCVEGFCFIFVICVIGMIMKVIIQSVQQYVGVYVLYWIGYIGFMYVIEVMIFDMMLFKNCVVFFIINGFFCIVSIFFGFIIG